jgi:sugar phosphate isomerase/epimerase
MEIGINLNCYSNELSIERQAELMKENGFTKTFDMSDSPLVNDETVGILKEAGITFATLHAPFSKINSMWQVGEDGDKMLLSIADGVDKCAKYNIPVLVVHLSSKFPPPRISDIGNERYQKLMDYAACKGVTIAYENQRTLSNLSYALEIFEAAGFCWDTGHEGCFTPNRQYMPLFGDRLKTVHIHDNMCEFDKDLHLLPFDGKIDFNRVAKQLAEAKYNDVLMLEVLRSNSNFYDDIFAEDYYKRAGDAAKRLAEMVEKI